MPRPRPTPNCELIVTDDGSKDESLKICADWLAKNKSRFERTELIGVEKNSGILQTVTED